jgi:CRP-like cAMP-binding protein
MRAPDRTIVKNQILAAIEQSALDEFFSDLHPVTLALRQVLYEVATPFEQVYFVEQGVVSILTIMADGSAVEVGMVGAEGMVGMPALLGAESSAQQFIVQIPGAALQISAARCKTAFDGNADICRAFHRFAEAMLNLSAQTAACNRLHSIEHRCARWLLMSSDRIHALTMPMTQEFLASMLGVRRAGVSEVAGELQRSGLIRYHRGDLTIIDREGLEAAACECYRLDRVRLDRLLRAA